MLVFPFFLSPTLVLIKLIIPIMVRKKVEDFANEKNIDFHQKIASNKTKLTASEPDIVLTENGKLPSEEYRESLTYAFLIENTLLDHSRDKALENVCFFLSLFIKGDHRYCAFTFQELSLR